MNNNARNYLFKPLERMLDLQVLEEIEHNPRVSQRELSRKIEIALGVTNACIKRMVRKGLIRLKGIPPRRIAYYLTPKGFAEKSKLMFHFFSYNIQHYTEMKKMISKRLLEIQQHGVKRIAFYGVGDEMEIASITLQGSQMKLAGIIDGSTTQKGKQLFSYKLIGLSEVRNLGVDGILVTSRKEDIDSVRAMMNEIGLNSIRVWAI